MTPIPWSYTSLKQFVDCPRQFHEMRVLKTVVQQDTPDLLWGKQVHSAFEDRQAVRTPLPNTLKAHEPFMAKLDARPGTTFTEQKIALDKTARAVAQFFSPHVWFRGVIDFKKIDMDTESALIVDYKTGKPHQKFDQLALFAIHTFVAHPVNVVDVQFYWTKTQTIDRKIWARHEVPALWAKFVPDLKQYAEAFKTNTWQPRQSGLCNGWCPVKECEFWRPGRPPRT